MTFVVAQDAADFIASLDCESVDLILTDPPYYGIVKDSWDNAWKDETAFVEWLTYILCIANRALKPHGSIVFFGGIGKHGEHPLFKTIMRLESVYFFRNMITWKKRRAYGKSHDYLFCREEIVWMSKSKERTEVTFNVPYLDEKRGYDGWNEKYKAKSEYKRVSNVWDDIPELMKPERSCQKPIPLMERLVLTHSNPGDLIVDPFTGWGTTGVAAVKHGRRFMGAEKIQCDALKANERVENAIAAELAAILQRFADTGRLEE